MKRTMRKRTYRRKRKSSPRMQLTRAIKNNLVYVKLRHVVGSIGGSSGSWISYLYAFQLSNIANYTAYTGVFDQYRINAVKLTFTPYNDTNDLSNSGATGQNLPRVYTLIDRNGITTGSLATENSTIENGSTRQIRNPEKPFSIYVKSPGIETFAETVVGGSNIGLTQYKKFIDTNNTNIAHYGAGVGWVQPNAGSGWFYHVVATYYLQFKNVA